MQILIHKGSVRRILEMKQNKTSCKKESFIDEVFGDEIEYARIYDENGITIIFNCDNKLIIKQFKNIRELIEKYISMYNENEFTNMMVSDLDNLMVEVQKENDKLKHNSDIQEEKILCNSCRNMEN